MQAPRLWIREAAERVQLPWGLSHMLAVLPVSAANSWRPAWVGALVSPQLQRTRLFVSFVFLSSSKETQQQPPTASWWLPAS